MATESLYRSSPREVISNSLWIILMFITAALIILHMFGKEVLFRNEESILRDVGLLVVSRR